ncbi:NupC/NupG family nucleoside CNT transporter [Paenibacillus arenosi]|uniref:Nucleoside permease n=1 Tax=Paenibacillus arenosi TaxID=2774142 RepID=A0ABR9B459_9BACL|nr:NupC/NupG family nucleoside CNT transporter [Paenibacillus arenosi]MBD8501167.1 NupC/NupG family nucleoside CNT transporter [Paenibacillus arenosi]
MNVLSGLIGIAVIFGIGFLMSSNRKAIKPRTILLGLLLQITFAYLAIKNEYGVKVMGTLSDFVNGLIGYANEGIMFLFGGLYDKAANGSADSGIFFVFAFQVLPLVIFFGALIAALYHLGIMQFIIRVLGGAISKLLGTSKPESLSAAANIFVGQSEAPLVVKPFLPKMTKSELFAVVTGGLASVSGSVLAGIAGMGVDLKFLLAACFMSMPSGLIMAKLFMPETDNSERTFTIDVKKNQGESVNLIEAISVGAIDGMKLAATIGAMLLAMTSLIAMLNGGLGAVGGWFGFSITLEQIFGYIFAPLALAIGVPWSEAVQAGTFIGQKIVLNEFVAYSNFAPVMGTLSEKTQVIITFALCGFANFSSIAICVGGIGSLVPERRAEIASIGLRAMFAGVLASLLSATIAGMFV